MSVVGSEVWLKKGCESVSIVGSGRIQGEDEMMKANVQFCGGAGFFRRWQATKEV